MQPSVQEYQKLLTEIIQKLIVVFGPAIVLAKIKNITDLKVDDNGSVTDIHSDPAQITRKTIEALKELSGDAVDRITEQISAHYPGVLVNDANKNPAVTSVEINKTILPAPISAPIPQAGNALETSLPIITAAPMPAPIPMAAEETQHSSPSMNQLNIAGQSNG